MKLSYVQATNTWYLIDNRLLSNFRHIHTHMHCRIICIGLYRFIAIYIKKIRAGMQDQQRNDNKQITSTCYWKLRLNFIICTN